MADSDRDRLDLAAEIARIDRVRAASRKRLAALTVADDREERRVLRIATLASLATVVVTVTTERFDEILVLLACGNGHG